MLAQCLPTDLAKHILPSCCTAWMPQWPSTFRKFLLYAHIHTQKSNLIIKIFRDTLFRDTHMASRSTFLDLRELTSNIKRFCASTSPLLPCKSPQVLGISFFIYCLSLSFTESLLFHQILSLSVWQMLILPPPPTCLTWNCFSLFCASKKIFLKNCVPLSCPKICCLTTSALPGH